MKLNKRNAVILLVLIAIGLLIFSGYFPLGLRSIVSVSDITIQKGSNQEVFTQVVLAINNFYESTWFVPKENVEEAYVRAFHDGSSYDVRKDIEVKFKPKEVVCEVSLEQRTRNIIGLFPFTYWTASESYFLNVPFDYQIKRDFMVEFSGTIDTHTTNSITKTLNTGGEINITNLGNLSKGYLCPSASAFAVVQSGSGYRVVDKSELEYRLMNTEFGRCSTIACILDLLALSSIPKPSGYIVNASDCEPNTSCMTDYGVHEDELNTSQLNYELPMESAIALVTVNMNSKFIEGVYFTPPSGGVDIIGMAFSKQQFNFGEESVLVVSVRNTGETGDTIKAVATPSNTNISIDSSTQSKSIGVNETEDYYFTVHNVVNQDFTSEVCVIASTSGQFGGTKTDTMCASITGKGTSTPPPVSCGNGICEFWLGENAANCSQDCEEPPMTCGNNQCDNGETWETCPGDCGCPDGYHLVQETSARYLIDFGPIKLWQTGTVETTYCEKDFPIELLLGLVFGTIILFMLLYFFFIKGRRRKIY